MPKSPIVKRSTLADLCSCGHLKSDHDYEGCTRWCDCEVLFS